MPTIKDVAKYAGVSHGTVSNVLNGIPTVSLENVKKVEEAMAALGYHPHASARFLKSKAATSRSVCIILPNIEDEIYSRFFTFAEKMLLQGGYYPELYITHDIAANEINILRQAESNMPASIILTTCQPDNTALFQELLSKNINIIFFDRKCNIKASFVGFQNKKSILSAVSQLLEKNIRDIALICGPEFYSCEQDCIDGYEEAFHKFGIPVRKNFLHTTDFLLEAAFRTTGQILQQTDKPSVLISTSSIISDGILRALHYICPKDPPRLITLGELTWKREDSDFHGTISKPVYEAAKAVTDLFLSNMESAPFFDHREIHIDNVPYTLSPPFKPKEDHATVRALILKGDMSEALMPLLPYILQQTNIEILLDAVDYEDLYATIISHKDDGYYDIYFMDLPWLHDLSANGYLKNLDTYFPKTVLEEISVEPTIFNTFSRHDGHIYALPYMFAGQLLFYRKDLFEDYKNSIQFQKEYNAPLLPPTTWAEFNAIARFFTRKYNPDSATEYGTTLGGRFSSAVHCEFLTRFWSYQNDVFDAWGNVCINTKNAQNALENYVESYDYASPDSINHWWYEQVREFSSGQAAMMLMYASHVSPIVDRNTSKILGKFGFAPVPGKKNTLGGWCAAISSGSRHIEDAVTILKMTCGKELATPLTLLGSFSANHKAFTSNIINDIYPWTEKSIDNFVYNRARILPEGKQDCSYKEYEQILARAVRSCIIEKIPAQTALETAQNELNAFLKR